jgi:hypothetical protein
MAPFLSETEVADMCSPLTQPAAQRRWLKKLGVEFKLKPNGRPLVSRQGVFSGNATGGNTASRQPDKEALLARLRGGKNGKTA